MDLSGSSMHSVAAYAAVLLGMAGPVVAIIYSLRIELRDFWRRPMMVAAVLTLAAVVTAYVSGDRLVTAHPELLRDPQVRPHLEYADRVLLPGAGFFVVAILTGTLNPRTGALRVMLPMLLTGFSVLVLTLILLSGDAGARTLWDRLLGAV